MQVSSQGRPLPGILVGHHEPIFDALPGNVLDNLRRSNSENALVWNKLYPAFRQGGRLQPLLALAPLWGTPALTLPDDQLQAYYWGFRADGTYLAGLEETLMAVDGPGPSTEVDCFLLGEENIILIEAKRGSGFGRCSRYNNHSCPAVHLEEPDLSLCRYWTEPAAAFHTEFAFAEPEVDFRPACDRHYQLARTLMVGRQLAELLKKDLHFWVLVPRRNWPRIERTWLDFTRAIKDSETWRRLRVLSWESLEELAVESNLNEH